MRKKLIVGIVTTLFVILTLSGCLEEETYPIPNFPIPIPGGETVNGGLTLHLGWNIVSMPTSIPVSNISFTYEGMPYSWNEAVDNELIWNVLWGYDGSEYTMTSYCIKTKGYWLCTKVDNIYISDEPLVICCSGIFFTGTEDVICNKVIVSDLYSNPLIVNTLTYDSIEFYYLSDGVLGEL